MSETVLVLRASKWEMTDEKTGEVRKGCTVHYINDYQVETANAVGDAPMKVQASDEVFNEVKKHKAPGVYEINTRTKPGKEGQATVVMTQAKFVKAFTLAQAR
ncbi:MAG: hypothetical protein O9318_13215 [Hylemonella sp.]|uniref:hypothetical protein n=1 Tax=Hylemonella sp. TaxID=2066020 RepID=UPI0022C8BA14|nr:hypothetical protein [Hylemonella sp.]MCZ8253425.1 hypothetical protein [Hylemonella sp.]